MSQQPLAAAFELRVEVQAVETMVVVSRRNADKRGRQSDCCGRHPSRVLGGARTAGSTTYRITSRESDGAEGPLRPPAKRASVLPLAQMEGGVRGGDDQRAGTENTANNTHPAFFFPQRVGSVFGVEARRASPGSEKRPRSQSV